MPSSCEGDARVNVQGGAPLSDAARERQRQEIAAAVRKRIAASYTLEDEIQLLRTAPSPEFEVYNAYVEDCLAWGRAERARRGL